VGVRRTNAKSHFTVISLDEVVGCIIVNVVHHLLYQQRLRRVVIVAGICVIEFYNVECTVTLSVKGSGPRDRKEIPHGL
jgi:hypothetical protein